MTSKKGQCLVEEKKDAKLKKKKKETELSDRQILITLQKRLVA